MTKRILFLSALFFIFSLSVNAADEWGIDGEEKARFEAKVVDIACELTGNCPPNCGEGKRQLGLLKDDGTLLLVPKNLEIFAGSSNDLISFCQKKIIADGLLIKNEKVNMFALQFLRLAPDGEWKRANSFIKQWSQQNPGENSEEWFRNDPMVKAEIKENGIFGIPGVVPEE